MAKHVMFGHFSILCMIDLSTALQYNGVQTTSFFIPETNIIVLVDKKVYGNHKDTRTRSVAIIFLIHLFGLGFTGS